jgi:Putative peptidase family
MRSNFYFGLILSMVCLLGCNKDGTLPSAIAPKGAAHKIAPKGAADTAGGDLHGPDYGAAWFLGTATVRYCVVSHPSFGVDSATIAQSIDEVLGKWAKYIDEKGVNFGAFSEFKLPTRFQFVSKCAGSEDLTFYFGVTNSQIEAAKKTFDHPISFAYRAAYDMNKGWGKGFVWFSLPGPAGDGGTLDWQRPFVLTGMLLHEMGHVLGCGHVGGTIMGRDIAQAATVGTPEEAKYWLADIDQSQELVLCGENCQHTYDGRFGELWDDPNEAPKISTFARLMGRNPKGTITTRLKYLGKPSQAAQMTLRVADDLGNSDFSISLHEEGVEFPGNTSIFVRARNFDAGIGFTYMAENSATGGQLLTGSLINVGGVVLPVRVQRNWMGMVKTGPDSAHAVASVLRIDLTEGASPVPLFSAIGIVL